MEKEERIQKIEELFDKLQKSHTQLLILAKEIDSSEIWDAEGAMQDVKAYLRTVHNQITNS